METLDKKELVISLIKDNLINLKLITGLNHDYYLGLGDTIFKLMGFQPSQQSDLIFERIFITISEKVQQIDISSSSDELMLLSMEIYKELVFAKEVSNSK